MNHRRKWRREWQLAEAVEELRKTWFKVLNSGESFWHDEIFVDNFAGGGGASCGMEKATGRSVNVASNHDKAAIAMHEANHPSTLHFCEDIWSVDPRTVMPGRPVGLSWFSPDCTHHSKARGGKPRKKKIRGLAWVVIRWAATRRPRVIMLENVEEFQDWGPLDKEGKPIKSQKGRIFRTFINALKRQGYQVEWRELKACDYGAPTIRKRFFLIARCDGRPIVWPEPTHGAPESLEVRSGKRKPWRTAAECIDWSIPVPSIFGRKKELADNTKRRIARGIMKFVLNNPKPFIIRFTQSGFGGDGMQYPINQPITTIMTKAEHAIVVPTLVKHYGGNYNGPGNSITDPLSTITTTDHNALITAFLTQYHTETSESGVRGQDINSPLLTQDTSNRFALVTAHIARHFGESIGSDIRDPLGTVTAGGGGKSAIVAANLIKFRGQNIGHPTDAPLHTVTAGGNHHGLVYAFLTAYYGASVGQKLDDPLRTVTTHDRYGLVLVKVDGVLYEIVDIGMRMLEPHELYAAQGFPPNYIINGYNVNGRPVTKADQVARCGNSVPPVFSEALTRANLPEHCTGSNNRITFDRYTDKLGQLQLSM